MDRDHLTKARLMGRKRGRLVGECWRYMSYPGDTIEADLAGFRLAVIGWVNTMRSYWPYDPTMNSDFWRDFWRCLAIITGDRHEP